MREWEPNASNEQFKYSHSCVCMPVSSVYYIWCAPIIRTQPVRMAKCKFHPNTNRHPNRRIKWMRPSNGIFANPTQEIFIITVTWITVKSLVACDMKWIFDIVACSVSSVSESSHSFWFSESCSFVTNYSWASTGRYLEQNWKTKRIRILPVFKRPFSLNSWRNRTEL